MIAVIVSYPNGQQQEVLLAGVPRVGERVRLRNGAPSPQLIVEYVLWVEGEREPQVIVGVRPTISDAPVSG